MAVVFAIDDGMSVEDQDLINAGRVVEVVAAQSPKSELAEHLGTALGGRAASGAGHSSLQSELAQTENSLGDGKALTLMDCQVRPGRFHIGEVPVLGKKILVQATKMRKCLTSEHKLNIMYNLEFRSNGINSC